jgi:uncharacterized protein YbaA (DUF1428 family)
VKATFYNYNYTFTPLAIFIVPSIGNAAMENKINFAKEIEATGNYVQISFSRAPKKNQEALAQLGKRWVQWLNENGVSSKIYYLDNSSSTTTREEAPPEGIESISKILSVGDDEMLGVSLQFYRDQAHANEVFAKMMQDETCGAIGKEFDGLVTQGKSMITDGFSRLRI